MEYLTYTFGKDIESIKGEWDSGALQESQRYLQPLERICQDAEGIPIGTMVEVPAAGIRHYTQAFLVQKFCVINRLYVCRDEVQLQSSVQTRIISSPGDIPLLSFLDKMRAYYEKEPAFAYVDSVKRLVGENLVPQGIERRK